MALNHTPDPEQGDDIDLDDESTEGHRRAYVGDPETALNRDIDPQSSRPQ